MSNIHIAVSGADAAVPRPATLTAGMVGAAVTFRSPARRGRRWRRSPCSGQGMSAGT